jgi:hypothetical protein
VKSASLLLAASLLANVALVALIATRPAPGPAGDPPPSATGTVPQGVTKDPTSAEALRAALLAGDARSLEAAGLPPDVAREIGAGRALFAAAERIRAARAQLPKDDRWWRANRSLTAAEREFQLRIRRELSDAFAAAGLADVDPSALTNARHERLAFLTPEKRAALRRITQDYDEMMASFRAGGIELPSDRERLKLLQAERERDIAALLTPAERQAYELRTSTTAQNLRNRYGDAIQTEDDFRKLYALQKAFDEKYALDPSTGRLTPETLRQRGEAQQQLQNEFRTALGEEKYAALRRASDVDLRNVESLVSRLNLPAVTTDRIAAARELLAAESQRINADTSLAPQQRRAQIQDLGARARADLQQTLGSEGAEAYAKHSPWVSMLQSGMAYSTTPPANSPAAAIGSGAAVHPVLPPGASGPGAVRQSVTFAAPAGAADFVAGELPTLIPPSGVQVMTFSTSETTTSAPAGGSTTQRVLVSPAQPVASPAVPPAPAPTP